MSPSVIGMAFAATGHLSLVSGAVIQEVIETLKVLNALRAAFPLKAIRFISDLGGQEDRRRCKRKRRLTAWSTNNHRCGLSSIEHDTNSPEVRYRVHGTPLDSAPCYTLLFLRTTQNPPHPSTSRQGHPRSENAPSASQRSGDHRVAETKIDNEIERLDLPRSPRIHRNFAEQPRRSQAGRYAGHPVPA